jgi:hypothetical protein
MGSTQVEPQLRTAMRLLITVEAFQGVMEEMFRDASYTIPRGCVLWVFTHMMMDMHPNIAPEIAIAHNTFIKDKFEPLDWPTLCV